MSTPMDMTDRKHLRERVSKVTLAAPLVNIDCNFHYATTCCVCWQHLAGCGRLWLLIPSSGSMTLHCLGLLQARHNSWLAKLNKQTPQKNNINRRPCRQTVGNNDHLKPCPPIQKVPSVVVMWKSLEWKVEMVFMREILLLWVVWRRRSDESDVGVATN